MYFIDTETCGFHGPIVLLQYAIDDGEIFLQNVWKRPIEETREIIYDMCNHDDGVVGFHMTYDWFHLCQLDTTLALLPQHWIPEDHINEYAEAEPEGRKGLILKPKKTFDLMLHARKGPYQSTMDREDIRIKRVPTGLAEKLADELEKRIPLPDIYFARSKNRKYQRKWQLYDCKDENGEYDPEFKDLILKFSPSSALKALAADALGAKTVTLDDIGLPESAFPNEVGYAPFAKALGDSNDWNGTWPEKIETHIRYWAFNPRAKKYATDDIVYTRGLYRHFGNPSIDDDDSVLACMVGALRWKGYRIDREAITRLRDEYRQSLVSLGKNFGYSEHESKAPPVKTALIYLKQVMTESEQLALRKERDNKESSGKEILQVIAEWKIEETCNDCYGEGCETCDHQGTIKTDKPHPAAIRAQEITEMRQSQYMINFFNKLLQADRFHASFEVIGALSNRMSGEGGDINAQGVKKGKEIRSCFPLADPGLVLSGGDFQSSQVAIMEAVYADPKLREDLLTLGPCSECKATGLDKKGEVCSECNGTKESRQKIHGLFAMSLFPGKTYLDIIESKSDSKNDMYDKGKRGVFSQAFGGDEHTISEKLGIPIEYAIEANKRWTGRYTVWGEKRKLVFDKFCSMRQPNGIGTKVEWHEPADYVESIFGFRRYFTLENRICKVLFDLAENPPDEWLDLRIKVKRRDRDQFIGNAVRSALFAAAFAIQAANMRAAANHEIQSPEATAVKGLQRKLWDIQPAGIHYLRVGPLNVHDELMVPTHPDYVEEVAETVEQYIEKLRPMIPLIGIDWGKRLKTWADK